MICVGVDAPLVTPTRCAPRSQAWVDLGRPVDQVRPLVSEGAHDLDQAVAIRGAVAADDDDEVDVGGSLYRRLLALLRGPADLVVHLDVGIAGADRVDQLLGVPHGERRLAGDGDALVLDVEALHVLHRLHEMDLAGCLADDPFRLRVAVASDVDDVGAPARELANQVVRADDVGAGRIDGRQPELDRPVRAPAATRRAR